MVFKMFVATAGIVRPLNLEADLVVRTPAVYPHATAQPIIGIFVMELMYIHLY